MVIRVVESSSESCILSDLFPESYIRILQMQKLTVEQAVVISAYTGVLCCNFGDMHEAVEKKVGREVHSAEFAIGGPLSDLKTMFKDDFMALCAEGAKV